jgi:hypothetical protein
MNFILFALAVIGMTNIVVQGKIMDILKIRPLLKKILPESIYTFFECYECCGFWCGMVLGAMLVSFNPFQILAYGFSGSILASFYEEIVYLIRSKTEYEIRDK